MRILQDSKYRVTILVLTGLLFLCGLPLAWMGLSEGVLVDLHPFYQARVTDMLPCRGLDSKTGLPVNVEGPLLATDERLEVCAWLNVDYVGLRGYPVPLYFWWRYENKLEYSNRGHMYSPGYIADAYGSEPGQHLPAGVYRVEIWSGRSLLASTELSVAPKRLP